MEVNYLLLAVVIILIACSVYGYVKGFLRIAVTLVGLVAIIMVVSNIAPYVSNYLIEKTPIYDNVQKKVVQVFSENIKKEANEDPNEIYEDITQDQTKIIESYNLPEIIIGSLIENTKETIKEDLAVTVFEEYIAGSLSRMVINTGTFLVLVAILWAGIYALLFASDILNMIPVLRTINKTLGMISGFIVGMIVIWLAFLLVITFLGAELSNSMLGYIKQSQILTYLFNSNPLFKLI